MPRGSKLNKFKVYFVQEIPIVHSTMFPYASINDLWHVRDVIQFPSVQKIACEHLRKADCTTSMNVYKNCFHYCENKLIN